MTTVVHRVDVDADAEKVFDEVADLRTETLWNPAARRIDLLTREPIGVGSRYAGSWLGLGRGTAEVVAFERPRHWRTRCAFRGLAVDLVGDVVPDGRACRLTLTIELSASPPLRPLLPVMARVLRMAGRGNMRRLERLLTMPGV